MSEQPPLSQTALIDEYRVLWTTQKKQKLKKWHDGFLRFHKFNKRMLVYDDARHLVADMYLRGRDAIGEGDDLEFEHHLVTIEDFKETVVQDLTPLFSPALQRKQQIQVGNAFLNSPTPNQANRHGPWGPNRHPAPTPRLLQQRQPMAAARSPQTPIQRKPTGVPGLTLQQAARQGVNYPTPSQDRSSRPVQQPPLVVPASVTLTADPSPQGLNLVQRSNPPQRPNLPQNPIQIPRQPRQNPVPTNKSPRRLPFHAPSDSLSPSRQASQPPPAPVQNPRLPFPKFNRAASRTPPHLRPRLPATTFDPKSNPDLIRPSPRPDSVSRPVKFRKNKRTPDVAFDEDSDFDLFEPPPDFQIFASPPGPAPASRQNNTSSNPIPSRVDKWSLGEARLSKPLAKQESSGASMTSESRVSETITVSISKSDSLTSESREDSEKEPAFEPLVNAGILRLNNATTQNRNKLLCQRPPNHLTAVSKAQSVKNTAKKSRTGLSSKPPSPAVAEDVMVIGNGSSGDKADRRPVDHQKPNDTFRGLRGACKKP